MLAQKTRREECLVKGDFFLRRMLARGERVLFIFLVVIFVCVRLGPGGVRICTINTIANLCYHTFGLR